MAKTKAKAVAKLKEKAQAKNKAKAKTKPKKEQKQKSPKTRTIIKYTGRELHNTLLNLLPYQAQLQVSDKKYLAFIAGTGAGKTYYGPIWLYLSMLERPGEEWIVSNPTIPMMKRNIIKYLTRFFDKNKIKYQYWKQDMMFDLGKLGIIYCISASDADRMQGIHAAGVVGDEAGKFERLWWDTAVQRVNLKKGRILLITTPYAMNWIYHDIYKKWVNGDPKIELVNPSSIENPFYDIGEYLEARDRLPLWKFKMLYHGRFTRPAGLIYKRYSVCPRFPIPSNWTTRARSIDFGFNNPTGILEMVQSPSTGIWYAVNEIKRSRVDYDEIKEILSDQHSIIYADPSEKQAIETLNNNGLPIYPAMNAVVPGILETAAGLKTKRLIIFDDLANLIDELQTYQWAQDSKEDFIDSPVKMNDHLVDALRYFWYTTHAQGQPGAYYMTDKLKQIDYDTAYKKLVKKKTIEEIDNIFGDGDDDD